MPSGSTPVPLSDATARLCELTRRVRTQHERISLTHNGEPEAVLLSVDDLAGLEITLDVLGDAETAGRIAGAMEALAGGDRGADVDVQADLARRRTTSE